MPAGVTWGPYLRYTCAAFLSMVAGSQLVHMYYNPLEDMNTMIDREKQQLRSEYVKEKISDEPSVTAGKVTEGEQKEGGGES